MKGAIILAAVAAFGLAGCNTSQPQPRLPQKALFIHQVAHAAWPGTKMPNSCRIPKDRPGDYRPFTGTGETLETAIVFGGDLQETTGLPAEYAYIVRHLPNWQVCGQALMTPENGRLYDQLNLTNDAGEHRTIYFDITPWFGKGVPT